MSKNMKVSINLLFVLVCSFFKLTYEDECGRPIGREFRLQEDRVVAGYDIGYYRYPWYVALTRYNMVSCGATLIGPKTVLTAAHCFKEFLDMANKGIMKLEQVYTVKLGVYNICSTEKTARSYTVEKVHIHELYYTKKPYYDISLLTLSSETDAYRPICLPKPNTKSKPPEGTVPGLGTLRYHGAMPCTVHEARLLIYNNTECSNMINRTGNNPFLIHDAFCAGYIQGGIDTCQGDSGGPLQSMTENGNYVLIGIVSFGFRCALPGLLGMYTDVSLYMDWIQEKSGLKIGDLQQAPQKILSGSAKPVGSNNVTISNGEGNHHHHHKGVHVSRPYRRPIKVIIYKNNKYQVMMKSIWHQPIRVWKK